ncbi:hypothetical protein PVAP13_5NG096000 [Panicum virgatum]|uniref:Uncharacterized protein n=1 Tax=Panicum virgatum TaxID=38727 RepID=A0A8T0RQH1_PANVG|nr:hypothetical protein PVAP13_5NG096000 [Panicum virgatum]
MVVPHRSVSPPREAARALARIRWLAGWLLAGGRGGQMSQLVPPRGRAGSGSRSAPAPHASGDDAAAVFFRLAARQRASRRPHRFRSGINNSGCDLIAPALQGRSARSGVSRVRFFSVDSPNLVPFGPSIGDARVMDLLIRLTVFGHGIMLVPVRSTAKNMINEQHRKDGTYGGPAQQPDWPRPATSPAHHAVTSSIMLDSVNRN